VSTQVKFAESVVEDAALAWLESLSWRVLHGPEIAPGGLPPNTSLAMCQ
jgi:type I restriction enzyme R subunit